MNGLVKCKTCDGMRSNTGETYGPRKVWEANNGSEPLVSISVPVQVPYVSLLLRMSCENPACWDGYVIADHYPHAESEPCVIRYKRCPRKCVNGIHVVTLGQGVMMPTERETIPWRDMAGK